MFNAHCGAADALVAVSKDLNATILKRPDLKEYVTHLGGTFNWRFIAGTKRLAITFTSHLDEFKDLGTQNVNATLIAYFTALDVGIEEGLAWLFGLPRLK